MIELQMKLGTEYTLNLEASTMNEMVTKIKEWQDWEDTKATLKTFKKSEKVINKECNSGWYYFS